MKKRIYMDIDEDVHELLRKRSFELKLPMKKLLESMVNSIGKEVKQDDKKGIEKRSVSRKKGMEKS